MGELGDFGLIVLVVSGGVLLALLVHKASARFPVPAPALFLLAALATPVALPHIRTVERIGVVALIMILFDGGMDIGWRRFRRAVIPIASLGVIGTFTTALVMAVCAHYLVGFDWTTAGILAAALAPTDPAVMFSILGNREIGGRTGTILEGEAGVNDPVGIALMIGMLEFANADDGSLWMVAEEFVLEMGVGLAVGVAGSALLVLFIRRVQLPSEGLYPLRTLAAAGVIYGLASVAGGSGFLAVFVAGLVLGDLDLPHKRQIRRFHMALASLRFSCLSGCAPARSSSSPGVASEGRCRSCLPRSRSWPRWTMLAGSTRSSSSS
jgi:cell volume regulation protein A